MTSSSVTCKVSFTHEDSVEYLSDIFSISDAECGYDKVEGCYFWQSVNSSNFVDDSLDTAYRMLADKIELLEDRFSCGLELRVFINIELGDRTPACSLSSSILEFFGKWAVFVDIDIQH